MDNEKKNLKSHRHKARDSGLDGQSKTTISEVNNDCLAHLFSFLSISERINILKVNEDWQEPIEWSFKRMKKLFISEVHTKDRGFENILKQALTFSGHSLREFFYFPGRNVYSIADLLSTLKSLHKNCPNLHTLQILNIDHTIQSLGFLAENFHNLKDVAIYDIPENGEKLLSRFFSNNKKLASLAFVGAEDLKGECMLHLPANSIDYFSITGCEKLSTRYVEQVFQSFTKLRTLQIYDNDSLIRNLDVLLNSLPQKSCLRNAYFVHEGAFVQPGEVLPMQSLNHFTNLECLELTGSLLVCDITLTTISSHCKNLLILLLSCSENVTDAGIQSIADLPKLRFLEITALYTVTDEAFTKNLPNLVELQCHNCSYVTLNGLINVIKNSKSLEKLSVSGLDEINLYVLESAVREARNSRTNNKTLCIEIHTVENILITSFDHENDMSKVIIPRFL